MTALHFRGKIKLLAKLSFRHLTRDKRRTLLTGSAISLGLALFIFSDHIQQGSYESLIRLGVSTQAGHLVIQPQGYLNEPKPEKRLHQVSEIMRQIQSHLEQGSSKKNSGLEKSLERTIASSINFVPRAKLAGLLQSPVGGTRTQLLAIDPQQEPLVSDWHQRLRPAKRPQGESGDPLPSKWLGVTDQRGILLGAKLAERLDLTIGDKVIFTFNKDKQVESRLFRVRGVLRMSSEDQEANTALITLQGYNAALKTKDQAQQLTLHLTHLDHVHILQERLKDLFQNSVQLNLGQKVEVLSWQEALPALYQFTLKDRQTSLVIFFIMGLMIAIGVLNTVAMSALERQRYFGVMMALGLTPRLLAGLLVCEAFILGVIASLVGLILGILCSWPIVVYGLDITSMVGEGMEVGGVVMESVIYGVWHPKGLIQFTLTSIILSVFASFWPAWRLSRLSALQAMHGLETEQV